MQGFWWKAGGEGGIRNLFSGWALLGFALQRIEK
jgi:hypothetical protein